MSMMISSAAQRGSYGAQSLSELQVWISLACVKPKEDCAASRSR
jgi:hypothetical protein